MCTLLKYKFFLMWSDQPTYFLNCSRVSHVLLDISNGLSTARVQRICMIEDVEIVIIDRQLLFMSGALLMKDKI